MSIAYNLVRNGGHYRLDAIKAGLDAAGYKIEDNFISARPAPGDILLIWNRYGHNECLADTFEQNGGQVVVVENGYYSPGRKTFALSLGQHHHGGVNHFPEARKMVPKPGNHILICAQRGIGSKLMASPNSWANKAWADIQGLTSREVRIREHPGNEAAKIPLAEDLIDCHAVVVWSSAAGVEALVAGVPVYYDAPRWIAEASAKPLSKIISGECDINVTSPFSDIGIKNALGNQWDIEDIKSGYAFQQLMRIK